jgi:cytoskeletal protein RodZ
MTEPTREQPEVTPAVTTAPAGSGWSRIPDHLGRARTSTVVLSLLFVAIFALYLNIRPDPPVVTPAGTGTPAQVSTPAPAPETSASPTSVAPESTTEESTTPSTEEPTTSAVPTDTSTSTPTTAAPTPTGTTPVPAPTVTSPAG